jgi:hypothetical protein
VLAFKIGERERGESRDIAEGNKDDARDGKDEDEAERDQDIDGAGGDAIYGEYRGDLLNHDLMFRSPRQPNYSIRADTPTCRRRA